MKTHTVTTYHFDELSEKAKEEALEANRDINTFYDWYDCVYDDATTVFGFLGFTFPDKKQPFYFSGFWSQGDGACIARAYFESAKVNVQALIDYAPVDARLFEIAERFKDVHGSAQIRHSGHYYHEHGTVIHDSEALDDDALLDLCADLCKWLYKQLERTYDDLTSDEAIAETLTANEYEFLESGVRYV